jgi:AraC-like DNA-binding protein
MTPAEVVSGGALGYFSINLLRSTPVRAPIDEKLETFCKDEIYVARPDEQFDLRFVEHTATFLVINVFKRELTDYAAKWQGGLLDQPLHLENRLVLSHPEGRAFERYLGFLWSEVQRGSPFLASDAVTAELEDTLLSAFLFAAAPQHADGGRALHSAPLDRAVDFIMEHLATPLSLGAVAAAAGVHARTLQRAFQARYALSVMAFVQECRLKRAREQLLAGGTDTRTVTSVALACGLWHLGRFSSVYRKRFGQSPVETLRCGRKSTHGPSKTVRSNSGTVY